MIIDLFEKAGTHEIAGIIDPDRTRGSEFFGYPVSGTREDLSSLLQPNEELFVAIGDNWLRMQAVNDIRAKVEQPRFATAIHPNAQIARGVKIGPGTAVMAGAVINSDATIGDFTVINTNASVDHDCFLGEFVSVAPGAILGGNVVVGDHSVISLGAKVKHGVTVGNHCVIGAGAVLLSDCTHQVVMYGAPAREIRSRQEGESYL